MNTDLVGKVLSIAVRPDKRATLKEIPVANAVADGGIDGDHAVAPTRGITFISAKQWNDTLGELGADLPWHTRRANVLIDAPSLGHWIGKTIRVGEVEVEILDETRPCQLMDQLHNGLRAALKPDCRGGVLGRVSKSGSFRVGDTAEVITK
ncbi:MAG: MOSC domain-containing protein [Planctomycetota bacterium]